MDVMLQLKKKDVDPFLDPGFLLKSMVAAVLPATNSLAAFRFDIQLTGQENIKFSVYNAEGHHA